MSELRKLQMCCEEAFRLGDASLLGNRIVDAGIPATSRVKVYANNLRETYRKTLQRSYPVIERLVGDDCFRSLALVYTQQNPSRSGDLQNFGAAFGDFLVAEYGTTEYAYLPDVARLEWAIETVLLEPMSPRLDPARLGSLAAEDLVDIRLHLSTGLRLLDSSYPVLSIWQANQPGRETQVDLAAGGEHIAVIRNADEVEIHRLDGDAYLLATAFAQGMPLGMACDDLPDGANLVALLSTLLRAGCLADFSPVSS